MQDNENTTVLIVVEEARWFPIGNEILYSCKEAACPMGYLSLRKWIQISSLGLLVSEMTPCLFGYRLLKHHCGWLFNVPCSA